MKCKSYWKINKNSYNPHHETKYSTLLFYPLLVLKKRLTKYLILSLLLLVNIGWWSYVDRPHEVKP